MCQKAMGPVEQFAQEHGLFTQSELIQYCVVIALAALILGLLIGSFLQARAKPNLRSAPSLEYPPNKKEPETPDAPGGDN